MEDAKLRFRIQENIEEIKVKLKDNEFDKYLLGLLDGFYRVLTIMNQISQDSKEIKNIYDVNL